jgi:hypothetical protein
MNRPWLRAGLIGAGALVLLNLLGLIPSMALSCLLLILQVAVLPAAGALAVYWLAAPYTGGQAGGQGALAGMLAGVGGGLASAILIPLGYSLSGGAAAMVGQLPPETLAQLAQAGVDPNVMFGGGTIAVLAALCCLPTGALVGALLGALGALVYATAKPQPPPADGGLPPIQRQA